MSAFQLRANDRNIKDAERIVQTEVNLLLKLGNSKQVMLLLERFLRVSIINE
jgi:hypothetical protein